MAIFLVLLDPEDEGTMILWNAGDHSPNNTVSYLRILESDALKFEVYLK